MIVTINTNDGTYKGEYKFSRIKAPKVKRFLEYTQDKENNVELENDLLLFLDGEWHIPREKRMEYRRKIIQAYREIVSK